MTHKLLVSLNKSDARILYSKASICCSIGDYISRYKLLYYHNHFSILESTYVFTIYFLRDKLSILNVGIYDTFYLKKV